MHMGQHIERLRKARGYPTKRSFARAFGLDESSLSRYEAGRAIPPDEARERIEKALGLARGELLVLCGLVDLEALTGVAPTPYESEPEEEDSLASVTLLAERVATGLRRLTDEQRRAVEQAFLEYDREHDDE